MKVLNSAGRSCISASSRTLMTPRPSSVRRRKSSTSNSGEPKNASASCCSSSTILRMMTPAVAVATPPYSAISALPSSELRWLSSARRSSRFTSGSCLSSLYLKTSDSTDCCVSLRSSTLASRIGPKLLTDARRRTPFPSRSRVRNSTGNAFGAYSAKPMAVARAVTLSLSSAGAARPLMSPLMSLMKTGTPASLSCSARTWSVFVLPVPVAPATSP